MDDVLEVGARATVPGTIGARLEELRALVHQHAVVLSRLVGVVLEAVAVALEALERDVGQEGQDARTLPRATGVDGRERHGRIDVICAAERGVVEETERDEHGGRQFAVREGDVEVLVRVVCEQKLGAGVDPGEAQDSGDGVAVAGVVEVHQVVGVFETEPLVGCEEGEGAEGRGTADHGLVPAELLHTRDVVDGPVEVGDLGTEAGEDGLGVDFLEGLGLRASPAGAVCWTSLVWRQAVRSLLFALADLHEVRFVRLGDESLDEALCALDRSLCRRRPDLVGLGELLIPVRNIDAQLHGLDLADPGQLLLIFLFDGALVVCQEGKRMRFLPVDAAVFLAGNELLHEGLDVFFIVEIVGVDSGMADKVRGARDIAALWRCWVERGIFWLKVWCNACQMLQRIERIRC